MSRQTLQVSADLSIQHGEEEILITDLGGQTLLVDFPSTRSLRRTLRAMPRHLLGRRQLRQVNHLLREANLQVALLVNGNTIARLGDERWRFDVLSYLRYLLGRLRSIISRWLAQLQRALTGSGQPALP